ncbi:MAG: ATP-binding protein [Gammaproteobacteria bacterium]|nr:ATP-binding protein [Gammaproteobacteria bacterium]
MKKELSQLVASGRDLIGRIANLLPVSGNIDWAKIHGAAWRHGTLGGEFVALGALDDINLDDLLKIDDQKQQIGTNTAQFVAGLPANNVLLWGARGTGKSSLIHALLNRYADEGLRLIEVDKQALAAVAEIALQVCGEPYWFLLVCDDLSFEADDPSYKQLKSALEGSVFKQSDNVLIYATSNRRHLLPEYMEDNLAASHHGGELHEAEAVEEKISLSDRFGLWLSFYPFKQDEYLDVVQHWLRRLGEMHGAKPLWNDDVRQASLRWALARGVRSGRTAHHFARHWIGQSLLRE